MLKLLFWILKEKKRKIQVKNQTGDRLLNFSGLEMVVRVLSCEYEELNARVCKGPIQDRILGFVSPRPLPVLPP